MQQVAATFLVMCLLGVTTANAADVTVLRYRAFGFSEIVLGQDRWAAPDNDRWISIDMAIDAPAEVDTTAALVNISVALFVNASDGAAPTFSSVVCNGEPASVSRSAHLPSVAEAIMVTFPFMFDPNSCLLRFLWPDGCRALQCDQGMQLSWFVGNNTAANVSWTIGGRTLEQADVFVGGDADTHSSPWTETSRAFCGRTFVPLPNSTAEGELRHLRVDVFGASNRWISIGNATSRTAPQGTTTKRIIGNSCRVRPVKSLRTLRELIVGPIHLNATSIVSQADSEGVVFPLNYIDPPSFTGRLVPQPSCFADTIRWFSAPEQQQSADCEGDLRARWFLPSSSVLVLIAVRAYDIRCPVRNDSVTFFALRACGPPSLGALRADGDALSSSITAGAPGLLSTVALPFLTGNTHEPSSSMHWYYCGDYGGTPSVRFVVWNVSVLPANGTVSATIASTYVHVSSNGFDAPRCTVSLVLPPIIASEPNNHTLHDVEVNDAAGCLGATLATVGRTPWYRIQYCAEHDRFWMATSIGTFSLSPCVLNWG